LQTRKTGRLSFGEPSRAEATTITQGLEQYLEPPAVTQLLRDKHLLIGKGNRQEVYLLSAPLWQLYQSACTQRHPYFVGLHLGELQAGSFVPSLHVLPRLLAKPRRAVVVGTTAEGAQRFIYGRDLEPNQLQQVSANAADREILVVNERGEGIGYGSLTVDKEGKAVLRNRKDLGWYLRRGQ
jgi:ribosome biogenesis protein Nip4